MAVLERVWLVQDMKHSSGRGLVRGKGNSKESQPVTRMGWVHNGAWGSSRVNTQVTGVNRIKKGIACIAAARRKGQKGTTLSFRRKRDTKCSLRSKRRGACGSGYASTQGR